MILLECSGIFFGEKGDQLPSHGAVHIAPDDEEGFPSIHEFQVVIFRNINGRNILLCLAGVVSFQVEIVLEKIFGPIKKGRRAIFEFLEVTPPIRELVHNEVDDMALRRQAIKGGMEILAENAFGRVKKGETTIGEAISVCQMD